MLNIVFVAGYGNSLGTHWQNAWCNVTTNSYWVEQSDWNDPECDDWVESLNDLLKTLHGPIVLVSHSLGGSTIVEWNKKYSANIVAAFMVAVPDVHSDYFPDAITGYQDLPITKLPFPSMLLASTDDPYASYERAEYFSKQWGSSLINVGSLGHVNVDSNIADWPEGYDLLNNFLKTTYGKKLLLK